MPQASVSTNSGPVIGGIAADPAARVVFGETSPPTFAAGSSLSAGGWVKREGPGFVGFGGHQRILLFLSTGTVSRALVLYINQTTFNVQLDVAVGGSTNTYDSGVPIPLDTWTHVAFSSNGTTIIVTVNGVQVLSQGTTDQSLNAGFVWGASLVDTTGAADTDTWQGKYCGLIIYTRSLTAGEWSTQQSTQLAPVSTTNIWAYLRMNSAATAGNDTSGQGHNASIGGTLADEVDEPTFSSSAPPIVPTQLTASAIGIPDFALLGARFIPPSFGQDGMGMVPVGMFANAIFTPDFVIIPTSLQPPAISSSDLALVFPGFTPPAFGQDDMGLVSPGMSPSLIFSPELFIVPTRLSPSSISASDLALVAPGFTPPAIGESNPSIDSSGMVPSSLSVFSLSIVPTSLVPFAIPSPSLFVAPPAIVPTQLVPLTSSVFDLGLVPSSFSPATSFGASMGIAGGGMTPNQFSDDDLGIVSPSFTVPTIFSPDLAIYVPAFVPFSLSGSSMGLVGSGLIPNSLSSDDLGLIPVPFLASSISLHDLAIVPTFLVSPTIPAPDAEPKITPSALVPSILPPSAFTIVPAFMVGALIPAPSIDQSPILPPGVQAMPANPNPFRGPIFMPYDPITIQTIDTAIRDWFDQTVDVHVKSPTSDRHKVPVIFSSGERFATSRKEGIRDRNGVLILPLISIRRSGIIPDPSMQALGTETPTLTISKRISPKSSFLKNNAARRAGSVGIPAPGSLFEVATIPFPDRSIMNYELMVWTQYITQMNEILEKIFNQLTIQKSFVATVGGGVRHPPIGIPFEERPPLPGHYFIGFLESEEGDAGNFEEFTDQERIVRYTTSIRVPATLQLDPEGERPSVQIDFTSFGLKFSDENFHLVDDPDEMERIFGKRTR